MKIRIFSFLLICGLAFSCSKTETPEDDLKGAWNLTNLSGGLAGLDCDYQDGDIVWTFDDSDLEVVNNLTENTICNSVTPASSSSYSILESNGEEFLLLDGSEIGQIIISTNGFTLNQNKFSDAEGADGFFMMFEK